MSQGPATSETFPEHVLSPSAKCKSLFYLETISEMVGKTGICFLCSDFHTKPVDSADDKCPQGSQPGDQVSPTMGHGSLRLHWTFLESWQVINNGGRGV